MATAVQAGFWDPDLRDGALRTEYPPQYGLGSHWLTLNYGAANRFGTDLGCVWNSDDPLAAWFKCPGRRDENPATWRGNLQARSACGGDATAIGDSWLGCLSYREDTYFALNSPGSRYWVVHANNDPAFDQCREGPPSASQRIVDPVAHPTAPNLFKIGLDSLADGYKSLNIIVAPWEHDFTCGDYVDPVSGGSKQMTIPYLSVGAHGNRGNGEPVGYVHRGRSTGSDVLRFQAQIRGRALAGCRGDVDDPCDPDHVAAHAGVLLVVHWGGRRHMLFVDLYREGVLLDAPPATSHWSWPIQDSMFWPGGEVAVLSAAQITAACPGLAVPMLEAGSPGPSENYMLPMSQLLVCAETLGVWSEALPDELLEVEAVDWFVEMSATTGMLWLAIDHPTIAPQ